MRPPRPQCTGRRVWQHRLVHCAGAAARCGDARPKALPPPPGSPRREGDSPPGRVRRANSSPRRHKAGGGGTRCLQARCSGQSCFRRDKPDGGLAGANVLILRSGMDQTCPFHRRGLKKRRARRRGGSVGAAEGCGARRRRKSRAAGNSVHNFLGAQGTICNDLHTMYS
jgi:hypothetical protein